jgi:hypothetical protein
MKEKIANEKCLNCELFPFANLSLKRDELDGGELYVLTESIKQKKIVPCWPMVLLYSCCMLSETAYQTWIEEDKIEEEELMDVPPLLELIWQCVYDLKASAFLALTAHYRGAIQLLRPPIENILVGLYFEERLKRAWPSENEINQAWADFDKWKEGHYKLNGEDLDFGNLKKWLVKNDILTEVGKKEFGRLWGKLGKEYIHPYFTHMEIGKEKHSECPATVRYDEDYYYEWLELFQTIIDFIIGATLSYYPRIEKKADAKKALGYMKILKSLEGELGKTMIISEHLKARVDNFPGIDELFEVEQ